MKNLASQIIHLAQQNNWRICTVESVTGGRIAAALTSVSGASEVFYSGGVFYDTRAKMQFLDLTPKFFNECGVYSIECAVEMASRWREQCKADFCISTTGEAEPVDSLRGRIFFAVADANHTEHIDKGFEGDRASSQSFATEYALQFLLKMMEEKLR